MCEMLKGFCILYSQCRYYLRCFFVSQLEALNIPYTLRSFVSSPKEGLVKGLWKNHSHEPQVLFFTENIKAIPASYLFALHHLYLS